MFSWLGLPEEKTNGKAEGEEQGRRLGKESVNLSLTCRSYKVFCVFFFFFFFPPSWTLPTQEMATRTWLPVFKAKNKVPTGCAAETGRQEMGKFNF